MLGDDYVDGASSQWEGGRTLEDLVVRFPWAGVWSRPNLDRRTRSLITVGILAATNRNHELELHIRGALRNGCTVDELVEVALHCAVYSGVPSGIDTVRMIRRIRSDSSSTIRQGESE
ncbi:carboxymuconolactone decarboxylase family protein [Streptacidiphilus fuscans]|uniref:carboxymuconolactone decarboxylase family protein n=1 Tax=Streptacidiphilus fuscans TaxID=2789292 RepID=UPI001C06B62D|nr:carboxymuconolactone decarboxylase family protein [Streptacidiphilus fuscans]